MMVMKPLINTSRLSGPLVGVQIDREWDERERKEKWLAARVSNNPLSWVDNVLVEHLMQLREEGAQPETRRSYRSSHEKTCTKGEKGW